MESSLARSSSTTTSLGSLFSRHHQHHHSLLHFGLGGLASVSVYFLVRAWKHWCNGSPHRSPIPRNPTFAVNLVNLDQKQPGNGGSKAHTQEVKERSEWRLAQPVRVEGEAELVRLMLPDDANPAGNVHGGTILRLIEQIGWIVAARHANSGEGQF